MHLAIETTGLVSGNFRLLCGVAVLSVAMTLMVGSPVNAQDPYPNQAIAFFNAQQCPAGWTPTGNLPNKMNGRFLVPLMPGGPTADTVGNPLTSGENPTHTHGFSSSIDLSSAEEHGASGGLNKDLAIDGTHSFKGTSDGSSLNVPYVQLLICIKAEPSDPSTTAPSGALIFFAGLDCPSASGWSQPGDTQGRFLLGVPAGGAPGALFGGLPLKPGENRPHSHAFSGSVSTVAQGILEFIGGAKGYGKNDTYDYSGTTGATGAGLPYMQILQCQKD